MKAGIIGVEAFRLMRDRGLRLVPLLTPFICTCWTLSLNSSMLEGISEVGDREGVLEVGVVMM